MYNCIICTSETNFLTKCGCHICLFCLLNWFEEKNRDKPVEILKCPNQECHFTYTRAEILSFCSQQPYERMIQEILLKEYLKNQEIRPCPNGKCKYFGYIELENKCDDELECLECGMKWRDFALASYTFQTEYLLKNIFGIIREFCYCFITTNECPECGVLIQRNGGCKHMTCKACAHQFCWFCKQQWGRHKESQCFSSQAISIVLLLTFPINVLHQFGIFYYFLYIFYPLYLILELLTINVIVIGTGFGIFFFFKSIFDLMNLRRRTCENVITFGASILLFIIDYFVIWFSTVFLDITFQKAFIGFLIEISIGLIVIGYLNRVSFRWIFLPIIGIFQFYYFGLNGLIMLIWQIPVIVGERNFFSQICFNLIALGLMVLYNIFSLPELFNSLPIYLLLGYTYFHYRTNSQKSNVAFVGILAISYLYEIIYA